MKHDGIDRLVENLLGYLRISLTTPLIYYTNMVSITYSCRLLSLSNTLNIAYTDSVIFKAYIRGIS
jgi:hypothetical protein